MIVIPYAQYAKKTELKRFILIMYVFILNYAKDSHFLNDYKVTIQKNKEVKLFTYSKRNFDVAICKI